MHESLRRVFVPNNNFERSWHVARLDCARWHICLNCEKVALEDVVCLWETSHVDDWNAATPRGWAFMKEGHSRALHYLVR